MEYNVKLQQLRKEYGLTQQQLADQLFVSRTAVSKWESGKGYPNIESLKSLSRIFSVSIDDLLSSEELITIAEQENRTVINNIFGFIFGVLDLMTLSFLFLPLFGQPEGEMIRAVNLFALKDASAMTRFIYVALPLLLAALGCIELAGAFIKFQKWKSMSKMISILLQAVMILVFINTRQPYATTLIFMLFMIKIVFWVRTCRVK